MRRYSSYVDDLDAKIITALQADGRQHNTAIARQLGVAEGTVRKRIERLLRDKVIQVGAWADPLKVGYQHYANIQIQVKVGDIERAAKYLATLPEIYFLGICTGEFDIFAAGLFGSNEHMHEFLTRQLAKVPGIQRTLTSSLTRIMRREHAVPVLGLGISRERVVTPGQIVSSRRTRKRKNRRIGETHGSQGRYRGDVPFAVVTEAS